MNLTVLLFGMLYTAGLGPHVESGKSPLKDTSPLQQDEILEPKKTVECKVTRVQPSYEVNGSTRQL